MRYFVLAYDYDGTIARAGRVGNRTVAGLEQLHQSGRKLILVTGCELDDPQANFPRTDLFDYYHRGRSGQYIPGPLQCCWREVSCGPAVAAIEKNKSLSANESRAEIRQAIEKRYTGPV